MNPEETKSTIIRVSGPLVQANNMRDAKMYEVVKVSEEKLLGEIIELNGDIASIQVYEETAGVGPGEPVFRTGKTMSVALAPGLLESIYDGIQRPLKLIEEKSGDHFIARGIEASGIDLERKWNFKPLVKKGDKVVEGDFLGEIQETSLILHKVMVPAGIKGTVETIASGEHTVEETVAAIADSSGKKHAIQMLQYWPIRRPRPIKGKIFPDEPMVTGGR
ncbi:MAG: V-type ATP synthase subunit A, partial [Candidatus Pacebacteria bacterium]|nr:V-type ATP synthase subunit A [Candidatus Paceibacterota bacterium]